MLKLKQAREQALYELSGFHKEVQLTHKEIVDNLIVNIIKSQLPSFLNEESKHQIEESILRELDSL